MYFELDALKPKSRSLWFYGPEMLLGCFGCEHHSLLGDCSLGENQSICGNFWIGRGRRKVIFSHSFEFFSKSDLAIRGHTCVCPPAWATEFVQKDPLACKKRQFFEKRLFRLRIKKSLFDKIVAFRKKFRFLESDFFRTKLRKSLSGKRRFFPEKRLFSGMQ